MDIARYWKTIVDTLQDGLMVIDSWGTIVAVNPAAERLTGYTREELVGSNCRLLNCTGCEIIGKGCGEKWCSLYASGRVLAKKCMITNKDHRTIHVIKNASVLRGDEGQVIGAVETLTDLSEIVRQQQEIESLRKTFQLDREYHGIVGKSEPMQTLFRLIDNVAQTEAPVMISGQSGTGKELVARAIHDSGQRSDMPFIKVNCAALNENLLESELFGHVKGAFTGAEKSRVGRFEAAHGGTIFLDEIGDIPLSIQVKLLRVLEEREIERVGDHHPISVDVRIITATNKDLEKLIATGLFREDLFFRINVFPLRCPSLVERLDDIPLIVESLIRQNSAMDERKIVGLTPEAMAKLIAHDWRGNVRELRNTIDYAFVLCPGGFISPEHLPSKIAAGPECTPPPIRQDQTDAMGKERLIQVLRATNGNQSEAAKRLGVSRVTIWKRIKKHGIDISAIR
jgi:two-component system, NtrC family, response regulator HydG